MIRALRISTAVLVATVTFGFNTYADDGPDGDAPSAAARKLDAQLQRAFKIWDRDKDEAVSLEELEKVYAKLKPKAKRKSADAGANAPNPFATVPLLHAALDENQDAQITREEFDAWTPAFAEYLAAYIAIQEKRAGFEQEKAKMQALLDRNSNVSALDGAVNDQLISGVIQWDQMIAGLDEEVAKLDTGGKHAQCRDFIVQHVLRLKPR